MEAESVPWDEGEEGAGVLKLQGLKVKMIRRSKGDPITENWKIRRMEKWKSFVVIAEKWDARRQRQREREKERKKKRKETMEENLTQNCGSSCVLA